MGTKVDLEIYILGFENPMHCCTSKKSQAGKSQKSLGKH